MNFFQKIMKRKEEGKEEVEQYLAEHGMEKTVEEFGIDKLCSHKILKRIEKTNLYCDYKQEKDVYTRLGVFLGQIPRYSKGGRWFKTCENGTIILVIDADWCKIDGFAVFDKNGKELIPYGKYYLFTRVPGGVVLYSMGNMVYTAYATEVKNNGTIEKKNFTEIKEVDDEYAKENGQRAYILTTIGKRQLVYLPEEKLEVSSYEKTE